MALSRISLGSRFLPIDLSTISPRLGESIGEWYEIPPMKRSKRGGKSVYINEVGVWWNQKNGNIHLTVQGVSGFHSTVIANPKNIRGNPNLYYKLAKCLRAVDAPYPPIPNDRE